MYQESGLPWISSKIQSECWEVFMAQNLLRYYKNITIELLEDMCKFFDENNYIGDGKIEQKQEGPKAV